MTPLFPAQRAAEEFEKALGGTATEAVADRYSALLETVEVLRAQPEVLPRVEFVDDLRGRLMTAAETELVAGPTVVRLAPKRTSSTRRRLGTAAASLVIVGGTAGMAAAASGALPGDPLYPVKRGMEEAGAAVRVSESAKGEALLDQAANRLAEVTLTAGRRLTRSRAARGDRGVLPQRCRPRRTEAVHGLPGRGQRPGHRHRARLHLRADGRRCRARGEHARRCDRRDAARRSRHVGRHRPAGPRPVRFLRTGSGPGSARSPQLRDRRGHGEQPARPPCLPGAGGRQGCRGRPGRRAEVRRLPRRGDCRHHSSGRRGHRRGRWVGQRRGATAREQHRHPGGRPGPRDSPQVGAERSTTSSQA